MHRTVSVSNITRVRVVKIVRHNNSYLIVPRFLDNIPTAKKMPLNTRDLT